VLGFPVNFREWRLDRELADLAGIDIGVAPLADSPWERGKCGVKLLQYMACGIPVVASPVGVHNDIVRDGVNGFLARNELEWRDRLQQLLQDTALRQRLGAAGRLTVQQHYNLEHVAGKVAEVLRKSAQGGA
jgi:glycosyltransferase involved in cell wall biosynthesis